MSIPERAFWRLGAVAEATGAGLTLRFLPDFGHISPSARSWVGAGAELGARLHLTRINQSRSTGWIMFDDLDAKTFDDPEFKEDAVREEVIAPMLRRLGYAVSGPNRIVRSRALVHPFVMIGSQKRRINIVPDYLLIVDDRPAVVLDAKAPPEEVVKSEHVEQAYSYAIHPDVRAPLYGLCNGRRLVIWDREHFEPILDLQFADFEAEWQQIEKVLTPAAILKPFTRDFLPDLGMSIFKSGLANAGPDHCWTEFPITMLVRTADDLYTASAELISVNLEAGGWEKYMVSLDFTPSLFEDLVHCLPEVARANVVALVSRQPYQVCFDSGAIPTVAVAARLGQPTRGVHEEFIPFIVSEVRPPISDPEAIAAWVLSRSKAP